MSWGGTLKICIKDTVPGTLGRPVRVALTLQLLLAALGCGVASAQTLQEAGRGLTRNLEFNRLGGPPPTLADFGRRLQGVRGQFPGANQGGQAPGGNRGAPAHGEKLQQKPNLQAVLGVVGAGLAGAGGGLGGGPGGALGGLGAGLGSLGGLNPGGLGGMPGGGLGGLGGLGGGGRGLGGLGWSRWSRWWRWWAA